MRKNQNIFQVKAVYRDCKCNISLLNMKVLHFIEYSYRNRLFSCPFNNFFHPASREGDQADLLTPEGRQPTHPSYST